VAEIVEQVWQWIECHVLDHHKDVPRRVGINYRQYCVKCKRLGKTVDFVYIPSQRIGT
jgi:hypothetical protein